MAEDFEGRRNIDGCFSILTLTSFSFVITIVTVIVTVHFTSPRSLPSLSSVIHAYPVFPTLNLIRHSISYFVKKFKENSLCHSVQRLIVLGEILMNDS